MRIFKTFLLFACLYLALPGNTQAQTWDWAISNNASFTGVVESYPTATDPFGNVFSAGMMFMSDTITIGPFTLVDTAGLHKSIIVKADATGNVLWVAHTEHSVTQPLALATDLAGCLYFLGLYFDTTCTIGTAALHNPAGGMMFFIAKFSPAGNVLWAHNIATASMTMSGSIAVDNECNVYATGTFGDSAVTVGTTTLHNTNPLGTSTDVFVAKYDSAGNNLWATSYGGQGNDFGSVITVSPSGTFYVSGMFNSFTMAIGSDVLADSAFYGASGANYYPYFAKFQKNGTPVWAKTPYRHINIMDIKTNGLQELYLAGSADSTIILGKDTLLVPGFQSALLAKYNDTGGIMWANAAYANQWANVYSIALDTCGNAWIGGSTDDAVNFSGYIVPSPAVHNDRMFIAAYDHCGRYIPGSGTQLGSGGDDKLQIALDNRGHLFVGGDYAIIPLKIGNDSLPPTPAGMNEFFLLARYTYGPMPCSQAPCCYAIPYASFTDTGVGTVHFSYTGSPVYDSVLWDFGDGTSTNTLNPTHSYPAGTYHACLTVYTTCASDSICRDITVLPTGVSDINYTPEVSIYPNPASRQFTIISQADFPKGATAELYDVGGRLIGTYSLSGKTQAISVTGLPAGVYQCNINNGNGIILNKQVVVK